MAECVELVVVGSVALDSVSSPVGSVENALGGSAVYFSLAASAFCRVGVVGVVGQDFPGEHIELLRSKGVDTEGLTVEPGRTFRWRGSYSDDFSSRTTHETCLNVFADFRPVVPPRYRDAKFLFLGNISPELQGHVLGQMKGLELAVADTMNFWIESRRESVMEVMQRCHGCMLNDEEAKSLSGAGSVIKAARALLAGGVGFAVIKRGEHGCTVAGNDGLFTLPAYPVEDVADPTGAGDSFAGGFMGYLAQCGRTDFEALKEAAVVGTSVASFGVEAFSVEGLLQVTREAVRRRAEELAATCRFAGPSL